MSKSNIELIDASTAYKKSVNNDSIINIKKDIIINIDNSIQNGDFESWTNISADTSQFIRDEITTWLQEKKYIVEMPPYSSNDTDPYHYYDNIKVSWRK